MPRHPLLKGHRICESEEPGNPGFFSESWVGERATAARRRTYLLEFLRWMREEEKSNQLKTLEKEFKGIRPFPEFPWGYIGGAPRGRYLDTWKNNTRELQTSILRRLGSSRPHSWKKNKKHRPLFSIEYILGKSQPVVKSELEDGSCIDGLPDAISVPNEQLATTNMEPPSPQSNDNPREASPRAFGGHGNDISQIPEDAESRRQSRDGHDPSTTDQDPSLSEHADGHDDHGHLANDIISRQRWVGRSSSSAEPLSVLSLSFERLANMSARLHCVEDENFDVDTVAWLAMVLGADESRRRLFYFYNHATVDLWYCLSDVVSQPVRHLTELGSSQEACISHGLSCKRVMVVKDELDLRHLRFESVHSDE
ncbi:hypothetical protein FNAPI_12291 [Fusarium napiforme]|uniref:Uncharacterized protein n=1 Tax=Fusarium napiforme TaxID=42672 RepID=A0A8H5IEP9_9HYPO|nr:hypothetical protein FNAPI_12291 [Fusarium napiforme]